MSVFKGIIDRRTRSIQPNSFASRLPQYESAHQHYQTGLSLEMIIDQQFMAICATIEFSQLNYF